jgi:hypothetical protein
MLQDKNAEEQAKGNGRDYEEIHRGDAVGMITQEGLPALRRRSPPPRHIFRHALLPDIDTELEELAMDPRSTPEGVGQAHLADQPPYLQRHLWPCTNSNQRRAIAYLPEVIFSGVISSERAGSAKLNGAIRGVSA